MKNRSRFKQRVETRFCPIRRSSRNPAGLISLLVFSTGFHWLSELVVILAGFVYFRYRLTHSSHVITSWLTSRRLVDCRLKKQDGGRLREIPLKGVSPNPLCPPPSSTSGNYYIFIQSSPPFHLSFHFLFHATEAFLRFNPFQVGRSA